MIRNLFQIFIGLFLPVFALKIWTGLCVLIFYVGQTGDVLITSRHQDLEEQYHIIYVPSMPVDDGIRLLLHHYTQVNIEYYRTQASRIVARLGGLALAIDQAAAYTKYKQLPIEKLHEFVASYEKQRKKILQHTSELAGLDRRISAFTTWEMSFQQLCRDDTDQQKSMAHFLTLSAFLGLTSISESFFRYYWERSDTKPGWMWIFAISTDTDSDEEDSTSEAELQNNDHDNIGIHQDALPRDDHQASEKKSEAEWDPDLYWKFIHQAHTLSLLQDTSTGSEEGGATFSLHPLIGDWLQLRATTKQRRACINEAIDIAVTSIQVYESISTDAAVKQSLLLHLDAILSNEEAYCKGEHLLGQEITTCDNAEYFASFYCDQGQFESSKRLAALALKTRINTLGKEHPLTLASMNPVAVVLIEQGRYEEAENMLQELIPLQETILGKRHTDTLESMDNLARLQGLQGKYAESEMTSRDIINIRREVLGEEHFDTLATMSNLADTVLMRQGKLSEAEQIFRKVLQRAKSTLGKEHTQTLACMANLAWVLGVQDQYEEAEMIFRETVPLVERLLGKEHPDTQRVMNNFAELLRNQEKYREAEQIYRKTFPLQEKLLGKKHPATLSTRSYFALTLTWLMKYKEAEQICREILPMAQEVWGRKDLATLTIMGQTTDLLILQNNHGEAEQILREAIPMMEKVFGEDDLRLTINKVAFARALSKQSKYTEAEQVFREVKLIMEKTPDLWHPKLTLLTFNLLVDQSKNERAEQVLGEIIPVMEEKSDKEDPSSTRNTGFLLRFLGSKYKRMKAEQILQEVVARMEKILGKDYPIAIASEGHLAKHLGTRSI